MVKQVRYIKSVPEDRVRLCTRFGVCMRTVKNALEFKSMSQKARQIRSYAVNFLCCYLVDQRKYFV